MTAVVLEKSSRPIVCGHLGSQRQGHEVLKGPAPEGRELRKEMTGGSKGVSPSPYKRVQWLCNSSFASDLFEFDSSVELYSCFMPAAPTPSQVFEGAVQEGERRLDQSRLELVSNGFIAGFTIVFGIVVLGIVQAAVEPASESIARIVGAAAFGIGLVFLIVGRTELFTENFFDPVAAVVERNRRGDFRRLARLWGVTFVFNFLGGVLLTGMMSVEGVLPDATPGVLNIIAEEIVSRGFMTSFFKSVMGGALVALLSFLLQAVGTAGSRITLAFLVGFLLALGPFDHVIVTGLHLFFGLFLGGEVGGGALAETLVIVTAGNFVGGLGLVTLTHIEQVRGERQS